jgi:hypothetical protein
VNTRRVLVEVDWSYRKTTVVSGPRRRQPQAPEQRGNTEAPSRTRTPPISQTVATQLLTATCDGDGLNPSKAQRVPAPKSYPENCALIRSPNRCPKTPRTVSEEISVSGWETYPLRDPNSRSNSEPDGIEEGDRIVNPKTPSMPPAPPAIISILEVAAIATRIQPHSQCCHFRNKSMQLLQSLGTVCFRVETILSHTFSHSYSYVCSFIYYLIKFH